MSVLLIIVLLLVNGALAPTKTYYVSPVQPFLVGIAWCLLLLPLVSSRAVNFFSRCQKRHITRWLTALAVMSVALFAWFDNPLFISTLSGRAVLAIGRFFAGACAAWYVVDLSARSAAWYEAMRTMPFLRYLAAMARHKFVLLLGCAFALRLLVIWYVPLAPTDVFSFMNEAPALLVQGVNPYAATYSNPFHLLPPGFVDWVYSYLPVSIIVSLPSVLLFHDVRYGNLVVVLLIAWGIYRWGRGLAAGSAKRAELVALAFLFIPYSLFLTEHPGSEPYLLLGILLWAGSEMRGHRRVAPWVLGTVLSLKQIAAPFLYFTLFVGQKLRVKQALLAGGIAILIMLPFFLWSPKDFVYDTVIHHARYVVPLHAVTLNSFYKLHTGEGIPAGLFLGFTALLLALTTQFVYRKRGVFEALYGFTVLSFGIFFFRQAFANYYYFVSGLLLILLLLTMVTTHQWYSIKQDV